jgi:hypothetical protein
MKKTILAASVSILLAGCATGEYIPTDRASTFYPPYEGPVVALASLPADGTYERLGMVRAKGGAVHSAADLLDVLKRKAAEVGANAVLVIRDRDTGNLSTILVHEPYASATALAIRTKEAR